MPTDLVARIDLDLVYPPFLARALDLVAACRARGTDYFALFGFRSYAQQAAMHAAWKAGTGGRAAPAGQSAHNFGLAIDFCADSSPAPGLQPVWHAVAYNVLGEEARRAGLVWGGSFGDRPHVQLAGYVTGAHLAPVRVAFEAELARCGKTIAESERTRRALAAAWRVVDAATGAHV